MASKDYRSTSEVFQAFLKMLRLDKSDISAIYLFAVLAGLVQLSLPLGIQTIVGFVMAGSISTSIVILIIMVVGGTFLNGMLQVRQLQLIEKLKQKIFVRYALAFSSRFPKLNIERLDNYHLPEMVNRFFEIPTLQKGIEKILLDIPSAIIQIFFGIILLSFYHVFFIAFGALLIIIIILIFRLTSQKGFAASMEASDYKYQVAAWLQDMARMIKSFKYAPKSNIHINKTDKLLVGYLSARTTYFRILITQAWSLIGFKVLITTIMLLVGATLLVNQQINIGQFIAADIVIIAIISSVEKLIGNLDVIYETFTAIEKMNLVIEAKEETDGTLELNDTPQGVSIIFEKINFTYPDGTRSLSDINIRIAAGQKVLIQGASGSGKSSLLRMLTGAFQGYQGSLLLEGLPLGNYKLSSIRSLTGVLLNQKEIFRGSLFENITMGDKAISADDIISLSEITGLAEFIKTSKEGLDLQLDPLGKRLSQRVLLQILILRAIFGGKRLLLLEEPFQLLNKEESKKLMIFFKNNNITVLIFSEKEEHLGDYDQVIRLEKGKQV